MLTAGAVIAQPRTVPGSVDAEFEKINQDVPGFGGMFYGADGTLKIYLTHPDKPGLLKSVVGDDAEILQGRYEFRELQGWRVRLRDVLSFSGVTSLDVDESVNQIRIGLDPGARRASAQQVRRQMRQLGVPKTAVRFEAREAMIPMQTTVQGTFNPVPGGVQINYPAPPGLERRAAGWHPLGGQWDRHAVRLQPDGEHRDGLQPDPAGLLTLPSSDPAGLLNPEGLVQVLSLSGFTPPRAP